VSSSRSNGHQVSPGMQPGPAGSSSLAEQAQAGEYLSTAVAKSFTDQLTAAVGLHRVWERAPAVMASAASPAAGA